MLHRHRWPVSLLRLISGVNDKTSSFQKAKKQGMRLEPLEDRTVPYSPLLGWGQSVGYGLQNPGLITSGFDFGSVRAQGEFYESVNAANSFGYILDGIPDGVNPTHIYNTEGPVVTVGGGDLLLGSGITFGRASGFGATVTPGNEILINGNGTNGGQLTVIASDAANNLNLNVESGSQVLLGDTLLTGVLSEYNLTTYTLVGSGIGNTGAIQSVSGTNIGYGAIAIEPTGQVVAGALAGTTLILNGPVNGVRSANAFSSFSTTGSGTVIMDNVFPTATVSSTTPSSTNNPDITFQVLLSETPQTDLTISNLTVTGGTVNSFIKVDGTTYTYSVTSNTGPGANGSVTAQVSAASFRDSAYLNNLVSNLSTVSVDRAPPTGSGTFANINASQGSATQATIAIAFADSGVGINPSSISTSNISVEVSGSGSLTVSSFSFNNTTNIATYVIQSGSTWAGLSSGGVLSLTVLLNAGSVTDLLGNTADAATMGSFLVDTILPALTVNQGLPIDSTNGSNTISITSSEQINSFNPLAFSANGGLVTSVILDPSAPTTGLLVTIAPLLGATQTLVQLNIAAGAVTDSIGNSSATVTPSPTYIYDKILPIAGLYDLPPGNVNNTNAGINLGIDFKITDPALQGVPGSGVNFNSITNAIVKVKDPSGNPVSVIDTYFDPTDGYCFAEIVPPSGDWSTSPQGLYTITIEGYRDFAGNTGAAFNLGSFYVATQQPTAVLAASPVVGINGISTVTLTIAPSAGLTTTTPTLANLTVTGNGTVSNLQTTAANTYSFDVTPTSQTAAVNVSFNANGVTDQAGNGNLVSNTLALAFNVTSPIPTFFSTVTSPTNLTTITGIVVFTEAVSFSAGNLLATDFNLTSGSVTSFTSGSSADGGVSWPFTIVVSNVDQTLSGNVKAGIATSLASSSANIAGSSFSLMIVVTDPTAALTSSIAPINSTIGTATVVPFQVKFTTGSGIAMDFSDGDALVSAISIKGGVGGLQTLAVAFDPFNPPNEETGVVTYFIQPPATTESWFDSAYQGNYQVTLLPNVLFDVAGNSNILTTLQSPLLVKTAQPLGLMTSGDVDANSQWINVAILANASTSGQIAIRFYPSDPTGAYLSPSELDRSIVPTAANFAGLGFSVVSVSSSWQLDTAVNAYYLAIQLAPAVDVVGDTNSVGPASLAINANAYFDIYGNGNSGVGSGNSFGYLSFLGIDRVSPQGSTSGSTPTKLNGSEVANPVLISINYSDATSGLNNATLSSSNLIVTLGADTATNVATITGSVDPNDANTFNYILSPSSGTWTNGTYTVRFTNVSADAVYDSAQSVLFDNSSGNGISSGPVLNGQGVAATFQVDSTAPVISDTVILGPSPTNVQPLSARVTFSEVVQGFASGNISLLNASLGAGGISTSDNINFTFDLVPTTQNGTVSFSIVANGITDLFGNALATGAISNGVVFDSIGPVGVVTQNPVNINVANGSTSTNTFSVTLVDSLGLDAGSVTVDNYLVDNNATITSVSLIGNIATYVVTAPSSDWALSPQGTYTITPNTDVALLPKDTLGNVATMPSTGFQVNTVSPTATASFNEVGPTNVNPLSVNVDFSEAVTLNTPNADYSNLCTVGNGSVVGFIKNTATNYTVTIAPTSDPLGERVVSFSVVAGAGVTSAGNPNLASNVTTIDYDNLGPVLSIVPEGLINGETNQQVVTVVVNLNPDGEYNSSGNPESGIILTNATYVADSFEPLTGLNNSYRFQISATGTGLVTVGFGNDAFDDNLGNGSLLTVTSYVYRTALTVAVSSPDVGAGGTTSDPTLNFVALFDAPIASFEPIADFFTVTNATITNLVQDPTNPARFTYTVSPIATGDVSVEVNAGAATDKLGNVNSASAPYAFTFAAAAVTATLIGQNVTPVTSLNSISVYLVFSEAVTGMDASNFVSKFTIGGATINAESFITDGTGVNYGFVINPTPVFGSNSPVAVSLILNAAVVTPTNQASNLLSFSYVNSPIFIGQGAGSVVTRGNPDGSEIAIQAFGTGYTGGVSVAGANFAGFTGSNTIDLLAVAMENGQGHVVIFNGETGTSTPSVSFYAFPGFNGVSYVAAGDVDADGFNDIVVSAGPGGGPNVKVYSGDPAAMTNGRPGLIFSFYAYASSFAGGASVTVGDINGDGFADVITGAGPTGGPHVKVFSGEDLANRSINLLASFYAGSTSNTSGVFVAAGDLTGDGMVEIITSFGLGSEPTVTGFVMIPNSEGTYYTADPFNTFNAYSTGFTGGVRLALVNSEVDGTLDLVTAPGEGGGPNLRLFELSDQGTFELVASEFFGDPANLDGLWVG